MTQVLCQLGAKRTDSGYRSLIENESERLDESGAPTVIPNK